MRQLFICLLLGSFLWSHAETRSVRLHINEGYFPTIDGDSFYYLAFNNSSSFDPVQQPIVLTVGDSLDLVVINHHTEAHTLGIGKTTIGTVQALDSIRYSARFNTTEDHALAEIGSTSKFRILGLSTMIVVRHRTGANFLWNIEDHSKAVNDSIATGGAFDMESYYPTYFTINGRSNPHINEDSTARVTGTVGDSIYIHVQNSGSSIHSLHFHGYHVLIVQSSAHPEHEGRSKDTCPIEPGEVLVLLLVPHQPGEYPVHDHNLVAVTGGNIYPNGMFTTLLIK